MTEVIFNRVAPVITVHDLEAALARYRRLGFETELDEPAQYGFVERGAVQLHLGGEDPGNPGGTGGVVYIYVSDADALYAEWSSAGVDGGFIGPHNTRYGLREFVYIDSDSIVHRVGSPLYTKGGRPGRRARSCRQSRWPKNEEAGTYAPRGNFWPSKAFSVCAMRLWLTSRAGCRRSPAPGTPRAGRQRL